MHDRPTATELLTDVADLLDEEVLPGLDGPAKHHVRVAANLCRIVEREVRMGPELEARETELLTALLARPVGSPAEGHRLLASRLRGSPDDDFLSAAWVALVEITRGKLAVAKPGYADFDFRDETS